MSADDDLRLLERRARASGSALDEAAWLSARLRAGSLERERLELAAMLGHEPSLLAVGAPAATDEDRLGALVRHLDLRLGEDPGREPSLGALLTRLTVAALGVLIERTAGPTARLARTRAAGQALVDCPCEPHRDEYFAASTDSYPAGQGEGCYAVEPPPAGGCAPGSGCRTGAGSVLHMARDPRVGSARVLERARADLVPWLLA